MIERRRGDIVFVTSDAVDNPRPGVAAYVASKWGLEGLARVMQRELEGTGVRATIVRPGPTATEMGTNWDPAGVPGVLEGFKRWGLLRAPSSTSCRCRPDRTSRSSRFNRKRRSKEDRDVTTTTQLREPPEVSGADGEGGHLEELRHDPIGLMRRVREECGDVGEFRLAGRRVVLLSGAEANEKFFRASEDELNQAEAYPFMTPIFGKGVIFDAPPERRQEMLHNQALKDKHMRLHAEKIATEVDAMVAGWTGDGEIDLLDFFAELMIYTSSACLIGGLVHPTFDANRSSSEGVM